MTDIEKKAFDAYAKWCDDGHPAVNGGQSMLIAIGYVVNMTDGRPDYDERCLLGMLKVAFARHEEKV